MSKRKSRQYAPYSVLHTFNSLLYTVAQKSRHILSSAKHLISGNRKQRYDGVTHVYALANMMMYKIHSCFIDICVPFFFHRLHYLRKTFKSNRRSTKRVKRQADLCDMFCSSVVPEILSTCSSTCPSTTLVFSCYCSALSCSYAVHGGPLVFEECCICATEEIAEEEQASTESPTEMLAEMAAMGAVAAGGVGLAVMAIMPMVTANGRLRF